MEIRYNVRTFIHPLNGSVMVRVRWERKSRTVVFSCGTYADKSKWDNERQKAMKGTVHVVGTHSCSAREINDSIAEINEIIDEAFAKYGLTALSPSVLELKEFVKGRLDEIHPQKGKFVPSLDTITDGLVHIRSLATVFDEFIEDMKDSLKWRSNYTEHHYRQVRNNVQACINQSVKHASISIGEIDTRFLNELKRWYVSKGYYNKTTNKQFQMLKTVLRWGKSKGYPVKDESIYYKTELEDPDKVIVYLKYDELLWFMDYPFPIGGQRDKARDLFCFMALTSLRYSDLCRLKKTDVLGETIKIYTKKTHKQVLIPITGRARTLIIKYKDVVPGEQLFRVPQVQNLNVGIRAAAKEAGLDRLITEVHGEGHNLKEETRPLYQALSCHDARRTFVCISLRLGIPAEIVMKSTGHSNYAAMKPYIEIMEESVTEQMKKWDESQQRQETVEDLEAELELIKQKLELARKRQS